jgi:hypothetical protein
MEARGTVNFIEESEISKRVKACFIRCKSFFVRCRCRANTSWIRDGELKGWKDLEKPLRDASRVGQAFQEDARPGGDLARRVQGLTRP